jgi:hypothetical protein
VIIASAAWTTIPAAQECTTKPAIHAARCDKQGLFQLSGCAILCHVNNQLADGGLSVPAGAAGTPFDAETNTLAAVGSSVGFGREVFLCAINRRSIDNRIPQAGRNLLHTTSAATCSSKTFWCSGHGRRQS